MNKCNICGEKIVLTPSASERSRKYGGKPSDYTALFIVHAECGIQKREKDTRDLMRRINARAIASRVTL